LPSPVRARSLPSRDRGTAACESIELLRLGWIGSDGAGAGLVRRRPEPSGIGPSPLPRRINVRVNSGRGGHAVVASDLLRRAVKISAAAYDAVVPRPGGLVVLLYHRVGATTDSPVDIAEADFVAQLEEVVARGPLNLSEAVAALTDDAMPSGFTPGRRVVVTFDDGTADFVDHALPLLVRHGVPATLYLATRFVEERIAYPDGARPPSWAGLGDALSTGLITIGTHTHSHALLDRVDPATAAAELDRSIDLIGERLGVLAEHFAYPKALLAGPETEREVRRRVRSAALAGTRPNRFGATDPYRLARSPISRADGMSWFGRKLDGGMVLEDHVRQLAGRRRYAGATT
jgi:peptidoglycan/xylan/chitin deacetylase (PgdA/CDA1 family)